VTAEEGWLKKQMELLARQASEMGLPIDLSYSMTFDEGGKYILTIRPEHWLQRKVPGEIAE
jgi:hypothetical protein